MKKEVKIMCRIIRELKKNYIAFIGVIISVVSLFFSIIISVKTMQFEEEYNKLNTYNNVLNYKIKISDKIGEGKIRFGDIQVDTGCLDIIPKVGGIEKVYLIQYYNSNVVEISCMELYEKGVENNYNAEEGQYHIEEYFLDHVLNNADQYLGTLFLVIKDYQNNYYINMIIYEFDKNDVNNMQTRIYSDVDLLYLFNDEVNLEMLTDYEIQQLMEYKTLKEKIGKILN